MKQSLSLVPVPRKMRSLPGSCVCSDIAQCTIFHSAPPARPIDSIKELFREKGFAGEWNEIRRAGVFSLSFGNPEPLERPRITGAEGYVLRIVPAGILLAAEAEAGFFYGLLTLRKILRQTDGALPCLEIDDRPDLPRRGFGLFFGGHWYNESKDSNPEYYRSCADAMAEAKLNFISFESEAFANDGDLEAFGEYCRARFIEPVPLHPFFCMCHKEVTRIVNADDMEFQTIMAPAERAIRLLKPKCFAIAGDELADGYNHVTRKSIYTDEERAIRAPHEWLSLALNRLHRFFTERNVRMAMWADAFLAPEKLPGTGCEMKDWFGGAPDFHCRALASLPKDVILWDWHYSAEKHYAECDFLRRRGFQVIGGAILTGAPERLFPLDQSGKKNFTGMMSITWIGPQPRADREENLLRCGADYWNTKHHTHFNKYEAPVLPFLKEKNPFSGLACGKHRIVLSGPGERFALASTGRIYCYPNADGFGGWHPNMKLYTDVWFEAECGKDTVFRNASIVMQTNGLARCDVFAGKTYAALRKSASSAGTVRKGTKRGKFDFTSVATGTNKIIFHLRIYDNENYEYVKQITLNAICEHTEDSLS